MNLEEPKDLVYIDKYGLLGSNFYWHKYEVKGITKKEILAVGLTNGRVQVSKNIMEALISIDRTFKQKGWRLYIKEGYRSEALYKLIYQKRIENVGKEEADRLINMSDMPHATGLSIDVALWDEKENKEVSMRENNDETDALFVDFYKNKTDEKSQQYQALQDFVIETMRQNGFELGTKKEYFHFDYKG